LVASTVPVVPAQASAAAVKPITPGKKARKHKAVAKAPLRLPVPARPNLTLEWLGGPKMDM
jgi:hypothetical protein